MNPVRHILCTTLLGSILCLASSLAAQPCAPPPSSKTSSLIHHSSLEYLTNPLTPAHPDSTYNVECMVTQWYRDSIGVRLQLQNMRSKAMLEARAIENTANTAATTPVYDLLLNALGEPSKQKLSCSVLVTIDGSVSDCIDTASKQPKRTFYLRSVDQLVLPLDSSIGVLSSPTVQYESLKDSRSIHIQANSQLQSVKLQDQGRITYNAPRAILGTSVDIGLPLKDVPTGSVLEVRTDRHLIYSRLHFAD